MDWAELSILSVLFLHSLYSIITYYVHMTWQMIFIYYHILYSYIITYIINMIHDIPAIVHDGPSIGQAPSRTWGKSSADMIHRNGFL